LGNGDGTFQPAKFSFTNSPYYPTFAAPGDFNGDGKPDLAVTETNDLGPGGAVAVLLGLGDGTFTTGQLYSGVAQPGSVAVGDFNGDGKLDLAVGNSSAATVSVLLSNGDGSFQSALPFDTNGVVGLQGDSLVVGDFNGDGKPDLAVAEFSSNVVSILINNTRTASYTLAVSETGNGSGLVTSSPSGINCEPSCSASYISGTPVTLTAQVATGSDFAGWSGCDTASGATCSLTMNAAKSVTASFNLQRFALTVSKVGTGSSGERSTVTSSSSSPGAATVDCGSSCSAIYDWGTAVTLTANPANGFRVAGWTGCATVSGATCTVTISGAKSVTASFEPQGFVHRP
jgi:hypothetical protein